MYIYIYTYIRVYVLTHVYRFAYICMHIKIHKTKMFYNLWRKDIHLIQTPHYLTGLRSLLLTQSFSLVAALFQCRAFEGKPASLTNSPTNLQGKG